MREDLDDNVNKAKYKLEYTTKTANAWLFITSIVSSLNLENPMAPTIILCMMANYIKLGNKHNLKYM